MADDASIKEIPTLSSVKPRSKTALTGTDIEPLSTIFKTYVEPGNVVTVIPGTYYIDGVLTADECAGLCRFVDQSSHLSFWSEKGRDDVEAKSFRNADTIEFDSEDIAEIIWNRIKDRVLLVAGLAEIVILDEEFNEFGERQAADSRWQVDICGTWQPIGFNNDMLLAKYPSNGSFAPHTDGSTVHNFNKRSFFSVVIFLNTIPPSSGGGTKFYTHEACHHLFVDPESPGQQWTAPSSDLLAEVLPVQGRVLIFDQQFVHEGVPPRSPFMKYIIRSDIMYTRYPAICTDENDVEAFKIYRMAEVLSEEGHTEEAIRLFKKAFRLSPAFARIMKQA